MCWDADRYRALKIDSNMTGEFRSINTVQRKRGKPTSFYDRVTSF